jgi:hypothetical protein
MNFQTKIVSYVLEHPIMNSSGPILYSKSSTIVFGYVIDHLYLNILVVIYIFIIFPTWVYEHK